MFGKLLKVKSFFTGWTPMMFFVRGALLSVLVAWVLYTFHLQNKIEDLNFAAGEQFAKTAVLQLSNTVLKSSLESVTADLKEYEQRWIDKQKEHSESDQRVKDLQKEIKHILNQKLDIPDECDAALDWLIGVVNED